MHEKYDIKGSWVSRNAEPPSNGQRVTCTHCEQRFIYFKKYKKSLKKQRVNSLNLDTPSDSRAVLELVDTENGKGIATVVNPMKASSSHPSTDSADDVETAVGTATSEENVNERFVT